MTVGRTIYEQIKGLTRGMGFFDWGCHRKNPVVIGDDYIQFKSAGLVRWKGFVNVKYNEGRDLYDVEFFRIRKLEKIVDKMVEGVYFDMLPDIIDNVVLKKELD